MGKGRPASCPCPRRPLLIWSHSSDLTCLTALRGFQATCSVSRLEKLWGGNLIRTRTDVAGVEPVYTPIQLSDE